MTTATVEVNPITWMSKKQLASLCNKSLPTIERHIRTLRKLKPAPQGFDYQVGQTGISIRSAKVVYLFDQLVNKAGRVQAIKLIKEEAKRNNL